MTERVVRIEKLAPTGEGIARTSDGVGFVDGALPGELVVTNVYQVKKKFWRGRVAAVREPSAERVGGTHAECAGCDWSFFEASAARRAKRELFRETMERLGRIDPKVFGELPVAPSAAGYRMRARLHVDGGRVGYFAPGSHRVVTAQACEALSEPARALLPGLESALREADGRATEIAILENVEASRRVARVTAPGTRAAAERLATRLPGFDAVRVQDERGSLLHEEGTAALDIAVGGRTFRVSADTFFQGNRHLVKPLYDAVAAEARGAPAGDALDAFGGVGLFAGALLDAGHRVVSVESYAGASADASATLSRWDDGDRWEPIPAALEDYLREDARRFSCVVADPPRAGLGRDVARELARRAERVFVYVSCDPATLARDLPAILEEGFAIRSATLFDLFAFTHRIEALVSLERAA